MLIYDRKGNSIDIYSIQFQKEKLRKYREKVISNLNEDELFYSLTTNSSNIVSKIENNSYQPLIYSNSVFIDNRGWLKLIPMKDTFSYNPQRQKEIIEKYIEGKYDNLDVKSMIERTSKGDSTYKSHSLLLIENFLDTRNTIAGIRVVVFETKNVIDLPNNLYLLYLLQHGEYEKLLSKNIDEQLSLFDIEYLKSVSIMDIKEMLETGLISETLFDAVSKVNIGSKILRKVKR